MIVAGRGNTDMIRLLTSDARVDINAHSVHGDLPLICAANRGQVSRSGREEERERREGREGRERGKGGRERGREAGE